MHGLETRPHNLLVLSHLSGRQSPMRYLTPDFPVLLAGAAALEKVRPGVHGGAPVARPHAQHQELGLQDQQEGNARFRGSFLFTRKYYCTEFPIPSCREVFRKSFREFPGKWSATPASYCQSRAGELPKQNMTKPLCMMGWETLLWRIFQW